VDADRFDDLLRSLATSGSRRGLVRLLAMLPLAGALALLPEESEARRRQNRKGHHRTRHDQRQSRDEGKAKDKGKGKGKGKDKGKNKDKRKGEGSTRATAPGAAPGCAAESAAQTCAGRCGTVVNHCGSPVDCGSCACSSACPACQTCNATTGRCETNPVFLSQACGFPGQICQTDGTCTCAGGGCPAGQRCNGIVCICDVTSCSAGCCDETGTCQINNDAACGVGGGTCTPCPGVCRADQGGCMNCDSVGAGHPCAAGKCCLNGACVERCPDCQACNDDGVCVADPNQNRTFCPLGLGAGYGVCCRGSCCAGCCDENDACGACLAFVTSTSSDGNLGGIIGAHATCQARAAVGSLPGTYKAWLSNSVQSPSTHFRCAAATCSTEGYVRVDGVPIATDWADLTDGSLAAPIDVSELNQQRLAEVWTYTLPDGTPGGVGSTNCEEWRWRATMPLETGDAGTTVASDANWTSFAPFSPRPCGSNLALYCFQQS
jgi:hypothetical protein